MHSKDSYLYLYRLLLCLFFIFPACQQVSQSEVASNEAAIFAQENLLAWCIVPFDSLQRGPAERLNMLEELGFQSYAYDWRSQHLDSFAEEIALSREKGIDISAVWVWINGNPENPHQLSADNEKLLQIMKENNLKAQIWLGFNDQMFEGLPEQQKIDQASKMIALLQERAGQQASRIGLYNHGGWFGDPRNQLKIIEKVNDPQLGIVYNFHHAHEQIDEFPQLLQMMQPYLLAVNLNGMQKDGPKILPIGQGNEEKDMMIEILKSGYEGPFGILGHVEDEDVAVVLQRNLQGLDSLLTQMNDTTL